MDQVFSTLSFELLKVLISHLKKQEALEVAAFTCVICIFLSIIKFPSERIIKRLSKEVLNIIFMLLSLYSLVLIFLFSFGYSIQGLPKPSIFNFEIKPLILFCFSIFCLTINTKTKGDNCMN